MPFTFLAHQAPVLPLKLRWPKALAGTALVVGSMAPDFEYFVRGQVLTTFSHTPLSQLTFCLPLTLLLVLLVRGLIAAPLAAHLPPLGPLHLQDYGLLAGIPPGYWPRALISALIGSASHLLLDDFTHDTGWSVARLPLLRAALHLSGEPVPVYRVLQIGGTIAGALVSAAAIYWIGRRRLLPQWAAARAGSSTAPPPRLQADRRSARALWGSVALFSAVGLLLAALRVVLAPRLWTDWWGAPVPMPGRSARLEAIGVFFCHAVTFGFLGICAGCWRAGRAMRAHLSYK